MKWKCILVDFLRRKNSSICTMYTLCYLKYLFWFRVKKPSKMDVAPWDEHWIQMVLDGIWWYWMVLLSSVFICFHRSFYCFYQFYLFSSFLICFFKCTPLWEYHLFEILTCWYDKSVKSVQNLYPQTIQLLESPIPTTTTSTTSQKASSHLTQVAISRESSVVA